MRLEINLNPTKTLVAATVLALAALGLTLSHLPPSTALSSDLVLKEKAAQIFEKERSNHTPDHSYLVALSVALKFQDFQRVSELVRQYETQRGL